MPTHIAYADETHHNTGRYRGISLVTLEFINTRKFSNEIQRLLKESAISELKWNKLRTAKSRFAALKIIDYIMHEAINGKIRVDTVSWDIEDSRHRVKKRDDVRNLRRMFYFIFRNVLCYRWPIDAVWKLCPDENTAVEWHRIGFYLSEIFDYPTGEPIANIEIEQIVEMKSHVEPFIQVADLFAGLAVFSRSEYDKYEQWLISPTLNRLSNSDRERFKLLAHLNKQCKKYKLGVSLKTRRGLRTYNPANPINFWWYEPQSELDKSPVGK